MNFRKTAVSGRSIRVDEVAREAGVSPITVSRTLSSPHKVKAETRELVLAAVQRTGYVVNSIASSLRSGRSNLITVFVASLQNPHFANGMQGTMDAFEGSRFHLMFAQVGYSDQMRAEVVESVMPFRPAGVMFTGRVRDDGLRHALREMNIPVMEMWGDGLDPIDMLIGSSTHEGGRLMGRHFGARGFTHVAYCGHTQDRGEARLVGFREGLAEHGGSVEFVLPMEGTRAVADGMRALDTILDAVPGCDAMFFGTDVLAVGAMLAAKRRNLSIPGDIAIAGYGDLDFAEHVEPSLTSINVSDYDLGRLAGSMLRRRLEDTDEGERVIQVPVNLRARASTVGIAGASEP